MSRTEKLLSLSEYERFVLMSLYRQAAEENGHPPGAAERKRIRDEYIASLGKTSRRPVLTGSIKSRGVTTGRFTGSQLAPCGQSAGQESNYPGGACPQKCKTG
ncbi:TPA: hypothetical protein ACIO89_001901 [Salmonella enterica subsp. enterica serovar Java]